MKKILFLMLCFGFFVIGCNKADDSAVNENNNDVVEEIEITETEEPAQPEDNNGIDNVQLAEQAKQELEVVKDYQKAIEYFDKSLAIKEEAWVFADRGRAKVLAGDVNGAVEDFSKAIEKEKRSVYYEWRADAYGLLGNEQASAADKAEAAKLPQEN